MALNPCPTNACLNASYWRASPLRNGSSRTSRTAFAGSAAVHQGIHTSLLAATCAYIAKKNSTRTMMFAQGRSGAARGDGGHDRGSFQLGPVEGGLSALKAFTNRLANLKNKRGKLVNELELAQKKLALSHASAEEMRRTLEEEVENERQAKLLISRQFIQATSSYEKLSDLLEFEQMKSSEQYKDLQARLQKAIIEHGKSQCAADEFQKKIVKLDKQCQQLQQENDQLKLQLLKADNVNDALKKQIAKQDALIEELMTLQHASQEESLQLRKENRTLKKRLEVAERSLALLLDPADGYASGV